MSLPTVQRFLLYVFIFSINFEIYDPIGLGFLSISKIIGLLYFASLLPEINHYLALDRIRIFIFPIFFFFLLLLLLSIININPYSNKFFDFTTFQNLVFFWLIINHDRRDPGILDKSLFIFALGGISIAVLYFFEIGIEYHSVTGRVTIFDDNENKVGLKTGIAIIILFLAVVQNTFRLPKFRFLFLIPIPLMITLTAETGSRIAMLSLVFSFMLSVFLFKKKHFISKMVLLILGFFASSLLLEYILQNEVLRFRILRTLQEGNLGGRELVWPNVLTLIQDSYFLGVGIPGYESFAIQVFGEFKSPHNVILEVLAYTGIIGLFLYLIFLSRLLFTSYKYYIKSGVILPMILFVPVLGMLLSAQLLHQKIGYLIFAFAASRVFYIKKVQATKSIPART